MICCKKPLVKTAIVLELNNIADTLEVIRELKPHDAEAKLTEAIESLREMANVLQPTKVYGY